MTEKQRKSGSPCSRHDYGVGFRCTRCGCSVFEENERLTAENADLKLRLEALSGAIVSYDEPVLDSYVAKERKERGLP